MAQDQAHNGPGLGHGVESDEDELGYAYEDDIEIVIDQDQDDDQDQPMDDDLDDDEAQEIIPAEDNSILTIQNNTPTTSQETKSNFSISTHPTLPLAIVGTENDTAQLFSTVTGQNVLTITGHTGLFSFQKKRSY